MAMFSPVQQQALQVAVLDAFSTDDLSQLTRYRLGQRLDVLVNINQGLKDIVFALIQLTEQRGWTEEFVRGVYEERNANPAVRQFCETQARFVFAPRTSTNDLAREVGTGLAAVAGRLSDLSVPVRAILVGQPTQTLSDLGTQFARLRQYKSLHDCLHNLQFKYARLITSEIRSLSKDPVAADNLRTFFQEMADELAQARPEIAGLDSEGAEQMWLNVADESVRRMRAAVSDLRADDALKGFQLLDGVLRVQPTRLNQLLTGLLERLQLDRLRDTLRALQGPLGDGAAQLGRAADALGTLTPRLNRILADHKEWQLLDNTLHQIDMELKLGSALEQCGFLWTEVGKVLSPILDRDRGAAWSQELRQLGSDLTVAFASGNSDRVAVAFKRLLPRAMWFFYQADKDLKYLSGELNKVGDKLREILLEISNGHP